MLGFRRDCYGYLLCTDYLMPIGILKISGISRATSAIDSQVAGQASVCLSAMFIISVRLLSQSIIHCI